MPPAGPVFPAPPLKKTCSYDSYREPYRISYPPLQPVGEQVEIGNTAQALRMRQAAALRQRDILQFEQGIREASPPITQPSATGTTLYGQTEGAGAVEPSSPPPPQPPVHITRSSPPPVVGDSNAGLCPTAMPVPGKPGYVYSPFVRNAGYVDVSGLTPGSMAKDPYSGRTFRVP